MAKTTHFCWTLHNYDAVDEQRIHDVATTEWIQYLCYGKETGGEGETPHLQGYIQLGKTRGGTQKRSTWDVVKNKIGLRQLHIEPCKGNMDQNLAYCKKEGGDFWEHGTMLKMGVKKKGENDAFNDIIRDIRDGASQTDICVAYPTEFIKHHAGIAAAFRILTIPKFAVRMGPFRWRIPIPEEKSLWLWGAAGLGKTCYAQYLLPRAMFVSHVDQLRGYNPNDYDGIIFDDMSFAHYPRESQIHIVDREQLRSIHVRYGCANIPAGVKKIFLSNHPDIFTLPDEAIERRLVIEHLL